MFLDLLLLELIYSVKTIFVYVCASFKNKNKSFFFSSTSPGTCITFRIF